VGRTAPLTIDYFMEVVRVFRIGSFQPRCPPKESGGPTRPVKP
jgi:hypothetical protein